MPEMLTPEEAAQVVRRSPHTLNSWRSKGTGPRARKIMGRVVYLRDDLDKWLSEQLAA